MTVHHIVRQLAYEYDGQFEQQTVELLFHDSLDRLAGAATVTAFLPTLAVRLTRERLNALAQIQGTVAKRVPEVLFVCVRNAGRSQMAAALTRHYAGSLLHIRTGGSRPGPAIHPAVEDSMAALGLSLDEEFPKPLTDEVLAAADVVVMMGCGDACPILPGRRYEDWPIADPADAEPRRVAAIRDEVDVRVRDLLGQLLPDLDLPAPRRPALSSS